MPYGSRIVADRDTSPQKRQACADVATPISLARMSAPLDADVSQGICGIHQRHPGTTPLDHTAHRKLPWICGRSDHCQIALKHGLSEADILHAYHHPIRAWDMGDGFTMLLGANRAALVLEIGYIQGITAIVIVHAMRAREKFLR